MDAEQRKAERAAKAAAKKAEQDAKLAGAAPSEGAPNPGPDTSPATPPQTPTPTEPAVNVQDSLGDTPPAKGTKVVHVFEKRSDGSEVHVRTFSSDPTLNSKEYAKKAEEFVAKFKAKGKEYFIPEE